MPRNDQYLSTQVLTASPYRLHLMVVEGAVRHARLAVEAMTEGDVESSHLALSQSRDYVAELIGGLNEEYEGELSASIKQLFFFAYINLAEGERERDLNKVQVALKVLESHHQTWLELGEKLIADTPEAGPSPPPPKPKGSRGDAEPRAWSA